MMASTLQLIVAASVFFVIWKTFQIIRVAFFTPLRHVPGPWYARFTGLPQTITSITKRQVRYTQSLHEKYGPYVRTGPNQVFVADASGFKVIHKVGGHFVKDDFYHFFGPTDQGAPPHGLFQMTNQKDHAVRRKLLGRGFTQNFLRSEWEERVYAKAAAAVEGMRTEAAKQHGEVDIRRWWQMMASDVISELMFGESFNALATGEQDPWWDAVRISSDAAATALLFPKLYTVLKHIPILGRARFFTAWRELHERGQVAVFNSKANDSSRNLFANVLAQAEADGEKGTRLTDHEVSVEAAAFMIAGSDTTSNTLTYLIWSILRHPALHKALVDEIAAIDGPLTDQVLATQPVLHAAIQETLRLYSAAPGPLPRVTPAGGAEVGGYFLPGGTKVSTQAWSMHRDPVVYPDPYRFDHTRWLPSGPGTASDAANAAFTPFGGGSRNCIGKNLAYMELRLATALFFRQCKEARLAPSTTDASMEMEILLLVEPIGRVCKVVL